MTKILFISEGAYLKFTNGSENWEDYDIAYVCYDGDPEKYIKELISHKRKFGTILTRQDFEVIHD